MIETMQAARAQFDIVFIPPGYAAPDTTLHTSSVLDTSVVIVQQKVFQSTVRALQTEGPENSPKRSPTKVNGTIGQHEKTKPPKKRVRFARDPKTKGKVKCEHSGDVIAPMDISPSQINLVWYCSTEYTLFKKDGKREIARRGGELECQKEYLLLYRQCASADEMSKIRVSLSAAFCASPNRGLEKLLFSRRNLSSPVVRLVLQEQRELRQAGVKDCTIPLGRFCTSQTGPARRMARVLGAGDERVVQELANIC